MKKIVIALTVFMSIALNAVEQRVHTPVLLQTKEQNSSIFKDNESDYDYDDNINSNVIHPSSARENLRTRRYLRNNTNNRLASENF